MRMQYGGGPSSTRNLHLSTANYMLAIYGVSVLQAALPLRKLLMVPLPLAIHAVSRHMVQLLRALTPECYIAYI